MTKPTLAAMAIPAAALALSGCGSDRDFTNGMWTGTAMPDFQCRGNLDVIAINDDKIQYATLGQVREEWSGLKTQFKDGGQVVLKGRSGDVFRFRDDGDGAMILEEAPRSFTRYWQVPKDIVRCPAA